MMGCLFFARFFWIISHESLKLLVTEVVGFRCMQAFSVPLVGVWVSGIATPTHVLVWLACLKFFVTSHLQDKVTQGNDTFLLLLYTTGQSDAAAHVVRSDTETVLFAG